MVISPRLAAIGVASIVTLLIFPGTASSAGPLPDPPADLPAVPAPPSFAVTPGSDGATVEVGAGDTTLQVGAGPGGVTINRGSRGSRPGAGSGPTDSLPVSIPGLRPGRSGAITSGTGPGGLVFGPSGGRRGANAGANSGATRAATQPGSTSRRDKAPPRGNGTASPGRERSNLPPFFEFIDRIPGLVKAGVAALALIALTIWAAWVRGRRRLAHNAFVDPVTGIANAPAFEGLLGRELERAKRYKRPLALLVLEVSNAHHSLLPVLDQTLRDVTAAIHERLREGDVIARLGPTRFAVICPEATTTSAETLARALELRLEEMRVHVAVGTAERQPTDFGPADLLARAEPALVTPDPSPGADRASGRALLKAA